MSDLVIHNGHCLCDHEPTHKASFHRYAGNGVWLIDIVEMMEQANGEQTSA